MEERVTRSLLGIIVAGIGGATAYFTTGAVVLSAVVSLSWGVSGWLLAHIWMAYPEYLTGDGSDHGRWDGLGAGVVAVVLFVGIRAIPVPAGYELAIVFVLLGVWTVGYFTATLSMIERQSPDTGR